MMRVVIFYLCLLAFFACATFVEEEITLYSSDRDCVSAGYGGWGTKEEYSPRGTLCKPDYYEYMGEELYRGSFLPDELYSIQHHCDGEGHCSLCHHIPLIFAKHCTFRAPVRVEGTERGYVCKEFDEEFGTPCLGPWNDRLQSFGDYHCQSGACSDGLHDIPDVEKNSSHCLFTDEVMYTHMPIAMPMGTPCVSHKYHQVFTEDSTPTVPVCDSEGGCILCPPPIGDECRSYKLMLVEGDPDAYKCVARDKKDKTECLSHGVHSYLPYNGTYVKAKHHCKSGECVYACKEATECLDVNPTTCETTPIREGESCGDPPPRYKSVCSWDGKCTTYPDLGEAAQDFLVAKNGRSDGWIICDKENGRCYDYDTVTKVDFP